MHPRATTTDVDSIESGEAGIGISLVRIGKVMARKELAKWRWMMFLALVLTLGSKVFSVAAPVYFGDAKSPPFLKACGIADANSTALVIQAIVADGDSPTDPGWVVSPGKNPMTSLLSWQLGCDSGAGDRVGCFQSQVVGVGPQIGFIFPVGEMQGYLNFKGYKEFAAENRPEGGTRVTISLPLA